MRPNDIDLQLRLGHHGWTAATLYVDRERYEFALTHVFSNPLGSIAAATLALVEGRDATSFTWHEEPGQIDWRMTMPKAAHHLLDVEIKWYSDILDHNARASLFKEIRFVVGRQLWITLVGQELGKIAALSSDRHYAKDRSLDDFPWPEYRILKHHQNPIGTSKGTRLDNQKSQRKR